MTSITHPPSSTTSSSIAGGSKSPPPISFESFPQFIDERNDSNNGDKAGGGGGGESTTLAGKLKRWIVGSSSSSTSSTTSAPPASTMTNGGDVVGVSNGGTTIARQRNGPSGLRVSTSGATIGEDDHEDDYDDDDDERLLRNDGSLLHLNSIHNISNGSRSRRPPPTPLIQSSQGAGPSVRVTTASSGTIDLVRHDSQSRTSTTTRRGIDDSRYYHQDDNRTIVGTSSNASYDALGIMKKLKNGNDRGGGVNIASSSSPKRPALSKSQTGLLSLYGSSPTTPSTSFLGGNDSFSIGGTTLVNFTSIPGFPLARDSLDDTRSVASLSTVVKPSASVAHVIRKLRGEGLSKDYWIKDESSKECFDCQTIFTAFRRKHHCRICGQIFCSRCASNIISSARFGQQGYVRVCNLCLSVLEHGGDPIHRSGTGHNHHLHDQQHHQQPQISSSTVGVMLSASSNSNTQRRNGQSPYSNYQISSPLEASAEPPQSQFAASHLFPRSETPYHTPSEAGLKRVGIGPGDRSRGAGGGLRRRMDTSDRSDVLSTPPRTPFTDEDDERGDVADEDDDEDSLVDKRGLDDVTNEDEEETQRRDEPRMSPKRLMAARGGGSGGESQQLNGIARRLSARSKDRPPSTAVAPFRRSLAEDETITLPPPSSSTTTLPSELRNDGTSIHDLDSDPAAPPPLITSNSSPSTIVAEPRSPHVSIAPLPITESLIDNDEPALGSSSIRPEDNDSASLFQARRTRQTSHRSQLEVISQALLPDELREIPRLIATPTISSGNEFIRQLEEAEQAATTPAPSIKDVGITDDLMNHTRRMLRQMLNREKIPQPETWEKVLIPLLVKVSQNTIPDIMNGDQLDVRNYVRIKKIPGGRPQNSQYVDGVVFTKNVLHKKMARELKNPRIMLISFPLEYQRIENQLVSIDPLIHQEKEYLHHLVQRIAAQRPHVVLVQKNVSRLALDYLMQQKITVARNVKASTIDHVARSTQSDIIASMDKLALEPRLGRCGSFKVQTFVHPSIPGGRKSLMRFEGCAKNLGCTLILRGGSWDVLHRVKKVIETMVLVVYGARLEGYLLKDELLVATPSILSSTSTSQPHRQVLSSSNDNKEKQSRASSALSSKESTVTPSTIKAIPHAFNEERERVSSAIAESLQPYLETTLSGSPYVQYPPPYPLARLSEDDRRLTELHKLREYEEMEQILQEEAASASRSLQQSSISSSTTSIATLSNITPTASILLNEKSEDEKKILSDEKEGDNVARMQSLIAELIAHQPPTAPAHDPTSILQTPQDLIRTSEIAEAESRHAQELFAWERYLKTHQGSLDPSHHQHLIVLETLGCTQTTRLCRPPSIRSITFFDQADVSLGQYIERICRDAGKPCDVNGCGRPLLSHYETWVHGSYRLTIVPEAHPVALERPELEGYIVMFSYCKICGTRTAMTAMSAETYRLSFGKYLELSFYPDRLRRADHVCDHNGHLDHVRYIMWRSITFTISMETIELRNVVGPSRVVQVKPERQLQLRNDEYLNVLRKSTAFWDSIEHRIASFNYDLIQSDRIEDCRLAMTELQLKCEQDRKAIIKLLESTYEHAQATNGTEMTGVRRALQNKAVDWEAEWTALEHRLIPTEKDVRRLTTVQLKKLFSVDDAPMSPERKFTPSSSLAVPSSMGDLDEKLEIVSEAGSEAPSSNSVNPVDSVEASDQSEQSTSAASSTSITSRLMSGSAAAPPPAPSSGSAIVPTPVSPIAETKGEGGNGIRRKMSMTTTTTDNESDSTVYAEPSSSALRSGARIPSPYNARRYNPEDTSGAESELERFRVPAVKRSRTGQNVAHLIDLFAEQQQQQQWQKSRSSSPTESRRDLTPRSSKSIDINRPALRRGVTEKPRTKSRISSAKDVLSDGDGSYARNVAVSHLSNRLALSDPKASRISSATRKPALSRTSSAEQQALDRLGRAGRKSSRPASPTSGMFASRISTSPTSSRPPSRSESRSGRNTPALTSNPSYEIVKTSTPTRASKSTTSSQVTRSTSQKGKSRETAASRDDSSETGQSSKGAASKASRTAALGISRPTASSINKTTTTASSGGAPARRLISHGSGRHVARIRSHFDRLTRENDRERERRFGLKKARPVGNVTSTIQVFDNAVDAAKEESDDDVNHSSDGGADDEDDDGDDDDDAEVETKAVVGRSAPEASRVAEVKSKELPSKALTTMSRPQAPKSIPVSQIHELAQYDGGILLSSMAEALVQPGLDLSAVAAVIEEVQAGKRESSPARMSIMSDAESTAALPSSAITSDVGGGSALPRMSEGESSGTERGSIIKAISSLWAYRGADFTPLEYPLASSEHIFADNPILVREDEPSSILAFALSSKAYRGKLEEQAAVSSRSNETESLLGDGPSWKLVDIPADLANIEDTLRKPEAKHFRLQFEDNSTTFFCKIFFAEQFDALRRNCGCTNQFIESLARCVKWDSSGGRSKVDFLKTKDDRFIVKEISRLEMDALLRFAPAYFDYMSSSMATKRPTLLAKIFGFYRIGLKNPTTGKTMKLDVLVTENLFYDRKLEQVFDLKGSTRNRLVQVTKDRPHEVLMDENLVEISRRNPLYIREDSKRYLQKAIINDSHFLAELNVMDYSLVVGVDASKGELVVGIVDFIRTYTWDKRIESWVKDSALLGGGSNKPGGPTIITPKQYKTRFCEAMNTYFLLSPDPWLDESSLCIGPKPQQAPSTIDLN